jgi:hypothetical protein
VYGDRQQRTQIWHAGAVELLQQRRSSANMGTTRHRQDDPLCRYFEPLSAAEGGLVGAPGEAGGRDMYNRVSGSTMDVVTWYRLRGTIASVIMVRGTPMHTLA